MTETTPTQQTPDVPTAAKPTRVSARSTASEPVNKSGVYFYIGPTIRPLIQKDAVFRGTKTEALKQAKAAIEKYPLVKTLIVPGDSFPVARLKVQQPGNALYMNYQKLLNAVKVDRKEA